MMLEIIVTNDWKEVYPGAHIGILEVSGVNNTVQSVTLDQEKIATVQRLREKYAAFTRKNFLELPVIAAYQRYYKTFDKTYHVLLQLESLVLKGKSLPSVSPLVDANFCAEVETLLLTASHDVDRLKPPLVIDIARKGDQLTRMSGEIKDLPPGDMLMRDQTGVICTILYGQDNVSPITAATRHALYVAYAPPGVGELDIRAQLQVIEKNIRLFALDCVVEQSVIL